MKILIAGSINQEFENQQLDSFVKIVNKIGEFFDEQDHQIIIHSLKTNTFDWNLVNYLNRSEGYSGVVTYMESVDYNPYKPSVEQDLGKLNISIRRVNGGKQAVFLQSIQEANIVMLLGGLTNTQVIGQFATLLGKPILPLPWAHGISESLWSEFRSEIPTKTVSEIQSVSSQRLIESDYSIVELLNRAVNSVVRSNPFAREQKKPLLRSILYLVLNMIILCLWFIIYAYGKDFCPADKNVTLLIAFFSIPLSVYLGAALRAGSFINGRIFLLNLGKSFVVSFGLLLIYLYVAYLSANEIKTIEAVSYNRFIVNFSVLGLASGLLFERMNEILSERLGGIVSNTTSTNTN